MLMDLRGRMFRSLEQTCLHLDCPKDQSIRKVKQLCVFVSNNLTGNYFMKMKVLYVHVRLDRFLPNIKIL